MVEIIIWHFVSHLEIGFIANEKKNISNSLYLYIQTLQ